MPSSMTLLHLEPDSTLHFRRALRSASPSRMLKLTNVHPGNVAFKVKTTAPKAYLVRPSSGTLRPNESQEVQIILQPTAGADGQAGAHRFLVQAVTVQSPEVVSREQWAEFPKEAIQEQRLNVILEDQAEAGDEASAKSREAAAVGGGHHPRDLAAGVVEQPGDLKVKYDELVQYTLMLEKEKKILEADVAELRSAKAPRKGPGGEAGSCSKAQLLLVAVLAFLLTWAPKLFVETGGQARREL